MDEIELSAADIEGIEAELRDGLRHVPAPEGFTGRVMARVAARRVPTKKVAFGGLHRHAGVWTSIAAALVLTVGVSVMHTRHVQKEREAEKVQAQMDLAMELTGHALDEVQGTLDRSAAGHILNGLGK